MANSRQQKIIEIVKGIENGERKALANAITLSESTREDHRKLTTKLLTRLKLNINNSLRIAITGTPGVGKSSFIDCFGSYLIKKGKKVAVLAIDPSSRESGGSILGDKTRMELLNREEKAFIRPSPTGGALGGTTTRTQEAIILCEAAGFDTILLETVGVGQSETMASEMVDVFCLLLAPGSGDELQGVKRGIMEISDIILVNKSDGEMKKTAEKTSSDYASALKLFRHRSIDPPSFPKVFTISSLEKLGIEKVFQEINSLVAWRKKNGIFLNTRKKQNLLWFSREIRNWILLKTEQSSTILKQRKILETQIESGSILPSNAAEMLISKIKI